jgi:transposase InsO family protein
MEGRSLKFLNVLDEYSGVGLAIRVCRRCKATDVLAVLEEHTSVYSAPAFIRSDICPEFNCFAEAQGLRPGSTGLVRGLPHHQHGRHRAGIPMENGFAESFNGRFRDEFLNTELFTTAPEVQILADRWRWEYNSLRPHSALQGLTPLEAAQ